MPTVKPEPPQLFNWFSLPWTQYERARRAEAVYRKWWKAGRLRAQIRGAMPKPEAG